MCIGICTGIFIGTKYIGNWNIYRTWSCWKMCRDDEQKEFIVLKILHNLEDWKISIRFRLRESCWELTSSNAGNYSTVNVGYVRRIYLFQLGAVLLVATVYTKSLKKLFQWIVGWGCIYLKFLTKRCCCSWNSEEFKRVIQWKIVLFHLTCFVKIFCLVIYSPTLLFVCLIIALSVICYFGRLSFLSI